jgi:predicted component of type VI protein secretion system
MTSAHAIAIIRTCLTGLALAWLGGCASPPAAPPARTPAITAPSPPEPPTPEPSAEPAPAPHPAAAHYRCDHDLTFSVRYGEDAATLDIAQRGREVLMRDAGGVTPRQTVYSNEHMTAEFGLGADGKDAVLRYAQPPLVARCTRE